MTIRMDRMADYLKGEGYEVKSSENAVLGYTYEAEKKFRRGTMMVTFSENSEGDMIYRVKKPNGTIKLYYGISDRQAMNYISKIEEFYF